MEPRHAREGVREEPRRVAQEGPLALGAAKLLEEGEREDLGVRELLEGRVSVAPRVEEAVGVVRRSEEDDERVFQACRTCGSVRVSHPRFLSPGVRMALVLPSIHATLI